MDRVRVADLPTLDDRCAGIRALTGALGATDVALNHFELAPGGHRRSACTPTPTRRRCSASSVEP